MDNDQNDLINELKRVLKPNGLLYVSDFLLNGDQRNTQRYNACDQEPYGTFRLQSGVMLRHHCLDHLQSEIFTDFDISHEAAFDVTTMNGNTSKAIQMIGKNQKN